MSSSKKPALTKETASTVNAARRTGARRGGCCGCTAGKVAKKAVKGAAIGAGIYALASAIAFEFTVDTKSPVSVFAMKASGKFKKKMATPSDFTAEAAAWFQREKQEIFTTAARDGARLHAWKFEPFDSEPRPHQVVLCVHGYMGDPTEMQPWAYHFAQRGFTVVVPSLRGDALDDGRFTGMGYTESLDVHDWVEAIVKEDPDAEILLDGTSMGGTTVLLAAGDTEMPDNVKAILADSAFDSSFEEMVDSTITNTHLPRPLARALVNGVDVINRFVQGFSFKDVSVQDAVTHITLPVLFLQGSDDTVVPPDSIDVLYDACASDDKHKLMIDGAKHTFEVLTEPELYWDTVDGFVDRIFPRK